jgi:hypothetical protein
MDDPIKLDAGTSPPLGVANPTSLTMYVGDPPRELLIFNGTAIPEYRVGKDLEHREVRVRLGAIVAVPFVSTATASLATISNDNSDFIFATDTASVDIDTDGTLLLHVAIGGLGDPSELMRFSYQVHVLTDPVTAKVSGLISWDRKFGDPTIAATKGGHPMFSVTAGQTVTTPGPPGATDGGFGGTVFEPASPPGFSTPPALTADRWVAAYEIDNVPLNSTLQIVPELLGGALVGPPAGYLAAAGFLPVPRNVMLTPSAPSAASVDFEMTFQLNRLH